MKPYAILMLADLRVKYFDTRDDVVTAAENLKRSDTYFQVFKYYPNQKTYAKMNVLITGGRDFANAMNRADFEAGFREFTE